MSRVARPSRWCWSAIALVALATPAHAWTDAAVRSVHARVVLAPDATAHVTLTATVRVHRGWLEGLELAGLDPDLALDEAAPPYAIDESGHRYAPHAQVRPGGRVLLSFPRQRAPRRGRVVVGVAYTTTLAHRATEPVAGEDRVRVRFGLPGWRSGLDGVAIEILAPHGARTAPLDDSGDTATIETSADELPEGTLLRFRRAHLPRTVPWVVAIDVPASAMDETLRSAPVVRAAPPPLPEAEPAVDPRPYWLALAGALALLALAKLVSVHRLARRSRARARPLLLAPAWFRAPVAVVLALAGGTVGPHAPLLALALFALVMLCATYLPARPAGGSRLGAWRVADARWLRAAGRPWLRALAPASLLDATTPLGLVHLAAWIAVAWLPELPFPLEARLCASVLPLPLFSTGARSAFPCSPIDALADLLALARRMRALPEDVALRPVVHVDVRGEAQDARVRTVLARRPRGLLRLDLAIAERAHAGGHRREPVLLIVTRAGSAAEKALAERVPDLPGRSSPGGRRMLRTVRLDGGRTAQATSAITRIANALRDCPEAPPVSRGTAVETDTVHELPAPRAVGF